MTTQAGTGRLVVDRPVNIYRDRYRSYDILVDGAPVGRIAGGAEVVLDLAPGFHHVQARFGATGSPPYGVTIAPGGYVRLTIYHAGSGIERYRRFSKEGYLRFQQH